MALGCVLVGLLFQARHAQYVRRMEAEQAAQAQIEAERAAQKAVTPAQTPSAATPDPAPSSPKPER